MGVKLSPSPLWSKQASEQVNTRRFRKRQNMVNVTGAHNHERCERIWLKYGDVMFNVGSFATQDVQTADRASQKCVHT